jgi:SRSO17 transposase
VAFAPREGTTLATRGKIAGRRWAIEAEFEANQQECGLDEYEVRGWQKRGPCAAVVLRSKVDLTAAFEAALG